LLDSLLQENYGVCDLTKILVVNLYHVFVNTQVPSRNYLWDIRLRKRLIK